MTRSESGIRRRLVNAGTIAWSVLGIVGVLVVGYLMLVAASTAHAVEYWTNRSERPDGDQD